jgi:cytochrome c-type biogenesis protein CcmE
MQENAAVKPAAPFRLKFIIAGLLIVAAVVVLVISSTKANAQYFLTVEELNQRGASMAGKDIRMSGAVLGESIAYDADTLTLTFTVVNIPGDNNEIEAQGGLAVVLHNAVMDSSLPRLDVVYNGVMPDLLKNEAQAIMTGRLGEDGKFYASELLLKCPTKYEEAVPDQAGASN